VGITKQNKNQFYIQQLKAKREQAINSLNQIGRQMVMLEGVLAFLNQAIEEAEQEVTK